MDIVPRGLLFQFIVSKLSPTVGASLTRSLNDKLTKMKEIETEFERKNKRGECSWDGLEGGKERGDVM